MDVSVKRERTTQQLDTTFLPVPVALDLEGCVLAPENEIDSAELNSIRRAIEARNRQWMDHPVAAAVIQQPPPPPPRKRARSSSGNESRRRRHQNETEEQRQARLKRDAERRREARRLETEEEARARRAKEAASRRASRQYYRQYLETEAEAQRRRYLNAARKRLQRQLMTAEQRDEMRRKGAARQAEKRKRLQTQKMLEKQLTQEPVKEEQDTKQPLLPPDRLLQNAAAPVTDLRQNVSFQDRQRLAMPIVHLPTALLLPPQLTGAGHDHKPLVVPNMVDFQSVAAAGLAPSFQMNNSQQQQSQQQQKGNYSNPYNYHAC